MINRIIKTGFPPYPLYFTLMLLSLSLWRCNPRTETIFLADDPVTAAWEIQQNNGQEWAVGDRIPLTLTIVYDDAINTPESNIESGSDLFEIFNQSNSKPQRRNESFYTETLVEVVYWSPGENPSPPVTITYTDLDGIPQNMLVDEIFIQIKSVRAEEDTQKKDLKPQAALPRPPIWIIVLAVVFVIGLLFGLTLWLLHRFRRSPVSNPQYEPEIDTRLPEEIALTELARIEILDLPAQGKYKQHYTLVSDCIRHYFENLFEIPALDRTTNEFVDEMDQAQIDHPVIHAVSNLLNEADLVKFAKAETTEDAARQLIQQSRALVEETRPMRNAGEEVVSV